MRTWLQGLPQWEERKKKKRRKKRKARVFLVPREPRWSTVKYFQSAVEMKHRRLLKRRQTTGREKDLTDQQNERALQGEGLGRSQAVPAKRLLPRGEAWRVRTAAAFVRRIGLGWFILSQLHWRSRPLFSRSFVCLIISNLSVTMAFLF